MTEKGRGRSKGARAERARAPLDIISESFRTDKRLEEDPSISIKSTSTTSASVQSARRFDGEVHETRLDNGVLLLTEVIPEARSVAAGVWVRQGSVHESSGLVGASHLLEHMVFKGTERRSAFDIALELESLGGALDAYTSREHTSYQARTLDEHLPVALDLLSDLVLHPTLRDADLELEKEVVLEEIATVDDTPDDLVFELHGSRLWGGHPYGRSILGTRDSVSGMTIESLRDLHAARYRGSNLVLAVAGGLDPERVVDQVIELFGDAASLGSQSAVEVPGPTESGEDHVSRETAQTHIVFGTSVPGRSDDTRYPLILLSAALGGGMSSRLFQRIREELALAYAVYTYQSFYSRSGVSGGYVGTRPNASDQAVDAIYAELEKLTRTGLTEAELRQAKEQVKGQLTLSLESTSVRLYRLAGFALYDEPFQTLDETLARIDAVSLEEVNQVARDFFSPGTQYVLRLGP